MPGVLMRLAVRPQGSTERWSPDLPQRAHSSIRHSERFGRFRSSARLLRASRPQLHIYAMAADPVNVLVVGGAHNQLKKSIHDALMLIHIILF